jgi:hypothetical protein
MLTKKAVFIVGGLLLLAALIVACGPKATPTPTEVPTAEPTPTEAPLEVPFVDIWAGSGHADAAAEAFNHWNEADPKAVPAVCARCHSSTGIVNYLNGASVDVPVPGGVITCTTCHNPTVSALSEVTFPSGAVISGLGPEARCMTCHQGRESKVSVDESVKDMDADTVNSDIKFMNIHYFFAGATLYGAQAHGGYEYDGKIYDIKFTHTEGIDTCLGCHDQHSLKVKIEVCQTCHEGVTTVEDLKNNRMNGSLEDYDGDGNTTEGIYYEIQGIQELAYAGIKAYAKDVAGTGIVYDPNTYPYFFTDAEGDGNIDQADGKNVSFTTWTPRLLKAAYNYQFSVKDPGAFAHNAKYVIELLCDSIDDLNAKLPTPVKGCGARNDAGHFAGSTSPFRDWDDTMMVPAGCSKCHSASGLPQFLANGGSLFLTSTGTLQITGIVANPSANGFMCSTCHDEAKFPNRYAVESVTLPSGKVVSFGGKDTDGKWVANDSNLCIVCHQGRESTASLNAYLAGKDPNTVSDKISFKNIHYFAAGATLFGNDAQGAYQFDGKTYVGQNTTHPLNKCVECHDTHSQAVKVEDCAACHTGVTDPGTIRFANDTTDWDGDGNVTESMEEETATLQEALYAQIQAAAAANGKPIVYSAEAYPYLFNDTNGNGTLEADEATSANKYNGFTPNLLKAAYNYQYSIKDPGAFAHNPKYIIQILIDSIEAVGGDVTMYTRP